MDHLYIAAHLPEREVASLVPRPENSLSVYYRFVKRELCYEAPSWFVPR